MNRNIYRLIFSKTAGMLIPVPESAHGRGKATSCGILVACLLLGNSARAELPVPCGGGSCGAGVPDFVSAGQAAYHAHDHQAIVNQVGDKAILNWESFNVSPGHSVQFQQVESLAAQNPVQGANFTTLNRIFDADPSVIAGILTHATGQNANIILVNTNGIAFMDSAQVNLGSFTASSLDIHDNFILNAFLTTQKSVPQFEGAGGFIKVFEGARITAGSQGRVMLIAPTVVNKGTVEAPDGQVIAAAGTRVFLRSASAEPVDANVRGLLVEVDSPAGLADHETANPDVKDGKLDGRAVSLKDSAHDKLGHVTNMGELSTPRGNVTMVGYAVNQQGIARATTSVTSNGSVYLLAKDSATAQDSSTRAGRVVLARDSLTEVLPEVSDKTGLVDGLTGPGLAARSQVKVLGQDIRMEGGAVINAPAGEVNFIAVDDPRSVVNNDPFTEQFNVPASSTARIHIAGSAHIDVAGLENVKVSAARNSMGVELRGDELKDSPVNRDGPLRSQKVHVDINRALSNADAGMPTLIARDSLQSYQARLERTVAERSTIGGTIRVNSLGQAIIGTGAVFDLSGGSLSYTPASVPTTLVMSRGVLTDIANARADVRYEGTATRYVQDYGRWNVKEVIDLGQTFNYDPGYTEGKNAGALEIIGLGAVAMQGGVEGRTVVGEVQRDAGTMPDGARLTLGTGAVTQATGGIGDDYKLNQRVELGGTGAALPDGFRFGDALPSDLLDVVRLDPTLLGKDKVANLDVFSNRAAAVRDVLRAPQGGSVNIVAQGLSVDADISAPGGSIVLDAKRNDVNIISTPLDVIVADGVTLSARGAWVNEMPGVQGGAGTGEVARVDGGQITLSAPDTLALGRDTLLDVTGGGRLKADSRGKVIAGNGGNIHLSGNTVSGLGGNVRGHGIGHGGTLSVTSNSILIGNLSSSADGTLHLHTGFFERAGFANIDLAGIENLTVAEGTTIRPTLLNLELLPDYTLRATGSRVDDFTRHVKLDDLVRAPVNLSLTAKNSADGSGDLKIAAGAHIEADPGAQVMLNAARLLDIQGRVTAPGGSIVATLDHGISALNYDASHALWLGKQATLDVSGKALTFLDSQRLTQGEVLNGGMVTLNARFGHVVTEAGSKIDIAGATPVRLDILNEAGGLGQWVGSDAGTLSIHAREGALLDGAIAAHGGSRANRGGTFNLVLGDNFFPIPEQGFPTDARVLSLAQLVTPQAGGLVPGAPLPAGFNGQARVGAAALEAAGFDRMALKSRDAIRLEDNLNLGAGRALPLKELVLDAPRIETAGGDASLKAEIIRLGNYDIEQQNAENAPQPGSGVLKAEAQLLELAGNLSLTGMGRSELTGAREIRLAGVSTGAVPRPMATLSSAADLVFRGAVVAPTTYSEVNIQAPGQTVRFDRQGLLPSQPMSALGSIIVTAENIVQDGSIWAPFGQLVFNAADTVTFGNGSLTSIAATPGSLIPFGVTVNGRSWFYRPDSNNIAQLALAEKSILTQAADIEMQAGATLDLAGGGDLQAYEFSIGPGGGRDILDDRGVYAILPGYAHAFAPGDRQENTGFDRIAGDAIYLSGISGLPAGVYTLLPAHYALLPGAFAVRLDSGVSNLLPGQAYSRQDGVQVVPGYVTDSRAALGGPRDAMWSGFEVLTREQVLQRSEMTLTLASDFFAAGEGRPQDGGRLSLATSGGLALDAIFKLGAADGGRGAAVDISAPNIAVISDSPSGIDPSATRIEADKLNVMGAASLFLGGTRSAGATDAATGSRTVNLAVGADRVTLANDAGHALKGEEIILAAKDTLTLKAGSVIDAQGKAMGTGGASIYSVSGNGALVRAASTIAGLVRTDSPDQSQGTLLGEAGSVVRASSSITLDATRQNTFMGTPVFSDGKGGVAGNLSIGAARVNLGNAPSGSEGLTLSQSELDGLNSLNSLTLTSYSTFDLYGDVRVGGVAAEGRPALQGLNLFGAGLMGLQNSGKTATLRAGEILLSNPAAASFVASAGSMEVDGALSIQADRVILAHGEKAIHGFSKVAVTADELIGRGTGSTDIQAAGSTGLNVARISSEERADQALTASGRLAAAQVTPGDALLEVNTLGGKWSLSGTEVEFDTRALLPSGQIELSAADGDLGLGTKADLDVAGRSVAFFDQNRASPGGGVKLSSDHGNVRVQDGARVNVSAAAGGDAGKVMVHAPSGTAVVAPGSLLGAEDGGDTGAAGTGKGARFELDVARLGDFSTLNTTLNQGGFDGARSVRVRTGDIHVAADDIVTAKDVRISADGGSLDVAGRIDASGRDAGSVGLYAKNDLTLMAGAKLDARATAPGREGGVVEIGTTAGRLDLAAGSTVDVRGGGGSAQAGEGGRIVLRAPRTGSGAGDEVAVSGIGSSLSGARSVVVEAVKVYDGIDTLTAGGTSSGATLSLAAIDADNASFGSHAGSIASRLDRAEDSSFHVRPGVEIRSAGDIKLAQDWNLSGSRASGEPGMLTLRAGGNLMLNGNLSDGFNVAAPLNGGTPATLLAGDSWSYRLVAGADARATDPLTVAAGSGDFTLAAGKLVRTGTGDIQMVAGNDIELADDASAIYTAGRVADPADGFVVPANAQFSQGGGDVSLIAKGNIVGSPSAQLYSNWLFRQGRLNDNTGTYTLQPAWWVRFDQFQQGVGALGGGNVKLVADGRIENVSASAPTQARMPAAAPALGQLVKTGGGEVRVETGGDLIGGQYYADRGDLVLDVGGGIDSGQNLPRGPLYTILALGDAQARVRAQGDVNIHTVLNPHLVIQSTGRGTAFNLNANTPSSTLPGWSLFSSYGEDSGVYLQSVNGAVTLHNDTNLLGSAYRAPLNFSVSPGTYTTELLSILPPSLTVTAFQGNIVLPDSRTIVLSPAARGNLELLASNSVNIHTPVIISDRDPDLVPDAIRPGTRPTGFPISTVGAAERELVHAATPVHRGDTQPARIYAVNGNIQGNFNELLLDLAKAFRLRAGQDVLDVGIAAQHVNRNDLSQVVAGRDVSFSSGNDRTNNARIWVGGLGRLEVTAGRNIDLGTSAGIVSRGDLDNAQLPSGGADIHVAAGMGAQDINYAGAVDRLVAELEKAGADPDDSLLWQARWLVGKDSLAGPDALQAVKAVQSLDIDAQRARVREMVYTALLVTGRDSNNRDSPYAADYERGYAALELLFPGLREKDAEGAFKNYQGEINLFASRIKTERGGNIEFMVPGGDMVVGLSNTPEVLINTGNDVLGMVTVADGNIRGFARNDILVNQSRILTVGGGDVLLWSSEGDIDAGKGKKTAAAVPPPLVKVDAQGNVTQELQGAASGSGIGALSSGNVVAGDIDLIAPNGTVNAGDAGIRAGNLNIAAQVVLGADNISVAGTSTGTPVADASAVTATTSGATSQGDDVSKATAALSQNLSEAAKTADEMKKIKPTFISAEVIGHGD